MTPEQYELIEALYLEMYDGLLSYANSSFKNNISLAEEAVQHTFQIACQHPEKLCASPNPRGWLYLTLKNTMHNMESNMATGKRILEQYVLTQAKEFSFSEDRVHLNILYENVADMEEFKLISEMAIDGKSHEEMAAARGISISACKKRVQRAKETLQRKLKNHVTK